MRADLTYLFSSARVPYWVMEDHYGTTEPAELPTAAPPAWDELEDWDTAPLRETRRQHLGEWDDLTDPGADYALGRLTLEVEDRNQDCASCGHWHPQWECEKHVVVGTAPRPYAPPRTRRCGCAGRHSRVVSFAELDADSRALKPKFTRG